MYKFGDKVFGNKTQAKKYFGDYIRTHDKILDENYPEFVDLVSNHPRGLNENEQIIIGINKRYGTARNSLYKVMDNKIVDNISYQKCIDGYNNKSRVLSCLRSSITDQINKFKRETEKPELCPICNKILDENFHIDHIIYFEEIVNNFLKENNIEYNDIEIVAQGTEKFIKDQNLVNRFKEYHEQHAQLRYVCAHCNLSREKYNH